MFLRSNSVRESRVMLRKTELFGLNRILATRAQASNMKKPKVDFSKIKTWEDLNKLESLEGIPTEQLEKILKQKTIQIKYAMNPNKPIKTETELELEYVKQLKQKEHDQRSEKWTNFKKEYGWSSVNWILYIFIGYYIAKSISLEMNYHINERILKERLANKVVEFETFEEEHRTKSVETAAEDKGSRRRKWFFGLW